MFFKYKDQIFISATLSKAFTIKGKILSITPVTAVNPEITFSDVKSIFTGAPQEKHYNVVIQTEKGKEVVVRSESELKGVKAGNLIETKGDEL